MKPVRLIPYICGAGASRPGCETGPVFLQKSGLAEDLKANGFDAGWQDDPGKLYETSPWGRAFHENLPPLGSDGRRKGVLWHGAYIRDQVERALEEGALPVTLGGDHSMAAGSAAGLARAKDAHGRIGMIWIDAHPDINTFETTPSKAFHGMPAAALFGMGDRDFATLGGKKPVMNPENFCYIGVRDVDPGEKNYIAELGLHILDMEDIRAMGMKKTLHAALDMVSAGADYLALSIDLDAFDPSEVQAIGSPVPGGLRRHETFPALETLTNEASFDLIEVAEFNASLPGAAETRAFVKDLLEVLL